jgi:RNA polymerase sigma-70 factor (ECF subfamily)
VNSVTSPPRPGPDPKLPAAPNLLTAAKAGDADALRDLLAPYEPLVLRLAFRMTGNADEAEDLAREAFLRILRRLPGYRGDCAFGSWVYRIALNVCLTARSRRRPEVMDVDSLSLPGSSPDPETVFLRRALNGRIHREIRRLPLLYREAVALRWLEDRTYEEIAEVTGVTVNTARARVHRGLKRLRERLQPYLRAEEER